MSWNSATLAHNSHKGDQARFFREGGDTLFPEELAHLGDLSGRTLVHLQCNAGQDTLSLARRGAIVTGVDISDTAISFAAELSAAAGIPARFERMDVYDWLSWAAAEERSFDLVFSSYGAICWLSDLALWARGVANILRPGGRLVLVEFHPLLAALDDKWQPKYDYFGEGRVITWEDGVSDYVGMSGSGLVPWGFEPGVQGFRNPHPVHEFQWTIADVTNAVLASGLELLSLQEYPYMNGDKMFPNMRELPGRRMIPPEGVGSLPLMFALTARRPERTGR